MVRFSSKCWENTKKSDLVYLLKEMCGAEWNERRIQVYTAIILYETKYMTCKYLKKEMLERGKIIFLSHSNFRTKKQLH